MCDSILGPSLPLSEKSGIQGQSRHGRQRLVKALAYSTLENMLGAVPIIVLALVFSALLNPESSLKTLAGWAVILCTAEILQTIFSIQAHLKAGEYSYNLGYTLRLELAAKLRNMPMGALLAKSSGNRVETILFDVSNIENIFVQMYGKCTTCVISTLFIGLGLLFISPFLTLCMFATIPAAFIYLYLIRRIIDRFSGASLDARRDATSRLLEYIKGIRTIRSLNMSGTSVASLEGSLKRLARASTRLEAGVMPLVEIYTAVAVLGSVFVILVGTASYSEGGDSALTLPGLLVFMVVSLRFYLPVSAIGASYSVLRYIGQSQRNVQSVLDIPEQKWGEEALEPGLPTLEFANVSFSYGNGINGRRILEDVSFLVPAGHTVALTGPSGAGKSTVVNLLARFWDPASGQVKVGGKDVRTLRPEALYGSLSLVLQDVHFFNLSILENLRLAKPEASTQDIWEALETSRCAEMVHKLPKGLNTVLGENASRLSGGEKRRLALARALLKDSPIVILDEATASLDPENEYRLQGAFERLGRNKTLLVIAHHLSTVAGADRILFLEGGRIVESGKLENLLQHGGRFAHFWNLQQNARSWKMRKV